MTEAVEQLPEAGETSPQRNPEDSSGAAGNCPFGAGFGAFEETIQRACAATGIPVTQRPVRGDAPQYLAWYEVKGRMDAYASNRAARIRHSVTIDLFAREAPVSSDVMAILTTLEHGGVRVQSWGAMTYEQDTGWYHLPINCEVMTKGGMTNA